MESPSRAIAHPQVPWTPPELRKWEPRWLPCPAGVRTSCNPAVWMLPWSIWYFTHVPRLGRLEGLRQGPFGMAPSSWSFSEHALK
eukprot:6152688-Pyramimonas_sp.AAC.1